MPNCEACSHLVIRDGLKRCQFGPSKEAERIPNRVHKTLVKACESAILALYAPHMRGDVLEVGPGVYRKPRKEIGKVATWYGVDAIWSTDEKRRTYRGRAGNLPFEGNRFDWVVSFSSIEHWNEFGNTIDQGLCEIYRVLKPGGRMLVTAPIHNHGHDLFYLGRMSEIKTLFNQIPWRDIRFEEWAKDPHPFPPLKEWKIEKHRIPKLMKETGGVEPSTFTLEVFAIK